MKVKNNFIKITKEDGLKNISGDGYDQSVEPYQDMAIVFQITDIYCTKSANLTNANGEHRWRTVSIQKADRRLTLDLTQDAFNTLE